MSQAIPTSINRSFASSSEDGAPHDDPEAESSSCFDRFRKKKPDNRSPLITSSSKQSKSSSKPSKAESSSRLNTSQSLQAQSEFQDPRKNYKELRRLSRITYTKLNDEKILKEFRQTGENKITSEKILKFLENLEPVESKLGNSFKGGVMIQSNGKIFIHAVNFSGEYFKLSLEDNFKVKEVEGGDRESNETDSVFEDLLKLFVSQRNRGKILVDGLHDGALVQDAVVVGQVLHLIYCNSEGIFHGIYDFAMMKKSFKFHLVNKDKSSLGVLQVAFSSRKNFLLVLKSGSKLKNKIIEILKMDERMDEKQAVFVDFRTSAFGFLEEKRILVVGTQDGNIYFHDTRIGERSFQLNAHSYNISKLFLLEDKVISFSGDKSIKVTKFPEQLFRLDISNKKFQSILPTSSTIIGVHKNEKSNTLQICEIFENNPNLKSSIKPLTAGFPLVDSKFKSPDGTLCDLKNSIHLTSNGQYFVVTSRASISFYSIQQAQNMSPEPIFSISTGRSSQLISKENTSKIYYQSSIFFPDYPVEIIIFSYRDDESYQPKESNLENFKFKYIKFKENITKFTYHIVDNRDEIHPDLKDVFVVCIFGDDTGALYSFSFKFTDMESDYIINNDIKRFDKKHDLRITAICHYNNKIWTASQDRTIKIWKYSTDSQNRSSYRLVYSIVMTNGVAQFLSPIQDDYVLSCTMIGNVNCFSATTFTKIFSIKLYGPIKCFTVKGKYIFYCNLNSIIKYELAINEKKENSEDVHDITVVGPDEGNYYQACKYLRDLLSYKNPEFNSAYDQWVILPYLISPLHFYAQFNMPVYVARSLYNGTNLNESTENQSALSIAVSKDFEECVTLIMKSLKFKVIDNPYFIDFFGDTQLIEMNFNGRKSLTLFYRLLLTKISGSSQPRFTQSDADLPIWRSFGDIVMDYRNSFPELYQANEPKSPSIQPIQSSSSQPSTSIPVASSSSNVSDPSIKDVQDTSKDPNLNENTYGKPVMFMRSLFKLSQERGEKRSIDVLRSFIECGNNDIYRTQFVQTYIELKFLKAKPFMIFEVVVYLFYLVLLCLYIEADDINVSLVIIPILVGGILSLMELFRLIAFGSIYLKDGWNICNFARSLLFYAFIGYTVRGDVQGESIKERSGVNYPLLLLVFLSFVKGILMFRLFDNTRYFLHLLQIVVSSSFSFMMVLIYVLIVISLILLQASLYSDTFEVFLGQAFLIVTGALSPEDEGYNIAQWIVFLVAVVLLTWIMMNLLVAIYNDSFETVYNYQDIYKYKTKAWMAYEVELVLLLFYKIKRKITKSTRFNDDSLLRDENQNLKLTKRESKQSYLYVCDEGGWQEEDDPIIHKVSKSKLKIKKTIRMLDDITKHVTRISDINKKIQKEIAESEQSSDKNQGKNKIENVLNLFRIIIGDALKPSGDYGDKEIDEIGELLERLEI